MTKKTPSQIPDVIFLLGIMLLSYGCWQAWKPLGYIVGGLFLSAFGLFLSRSANVRR